MNSILQYLSVGFSDGQIQLFIATQHHKNFCHQSVTIIIQYTSFKQFMTCLKTLHVSSVLLDDQI